MPILVIALLVLFAFGLIGVLLLFAMAVENRQENAARPAAHKTGDQLGKL